MTTNPATTRAIDAATDALAFARFTAMNRADGFDEILAALNRASDVLATASALNRHAAANPPAATHNTADQ